MGKVRWRHNNKGDDVNGEEPEKFLCIGGMTGERFGFSDYNLKVKYVRDIMCDIPHFEDESLSLLSRCSIIFIKVLGKGNPNW